MTVAPLSLILLPTLDCNVACDYCFERKAPIRLSLNDVPRLTTSILDHMVATGALDAEVYWQGGEALLLGPAWFAFAHASMSAVRPGRQAGIRLRVLQSTTAQVPRQVERQAGTGQAHD